MSESPDKNKTKQQPWTTNEKKLLYQALVKYGPDDLNNLEKAVPSKNLTSIKKLLNIYKNLADKSLYSDEVQILRKNKTVRPAKCKYNTKDAPITMWLNILLKSGHGESSNNNHLSEAFHLIAHLETHPSSEESHGVNYKELYLYLANLLTGDTMCSLNAESLEFLNNSLLSLAAKVKQRHMREVDFIENITHIFPDVRDSTKKQNTSIDQLASSVLYNPLALTTEILKRS